MRTWDDARQKWTPAGRVQDTIKKLSGGLLLDSDQLVTGHLPLSWLSCSSTLKVRRKETCYRYKEHKGWININFIVGVKVSRKQPVSFSYSKLYTSSYDRTVCRKKRDRKILLLFSSLNLCSLSRLPVQSLSDEPVLSSETVLESQTSQTWEGQDCWHGSTPETTGNMCTFMTSEGVYYH